MSVYSSLKRIKNECIDLEKQSDKKILPDNYYTVHIHVEEGNNEDIIKSCKFFLKKTEAFLGYVHGDCDIYLIFSCLQDGGNHFLDGSHQNICSYFSSVVSRNYDCNVISKIIEFECKTTILLYFSYLIFKNLSKYVSDKSSNTLKEKDIEFLTLSEIENALSKFSLKFNEIPQSEKYGTFYKLISGDNFETLSEPIDIRKRDTYDVFFFE